MTVRVGINGFGRIGRNFFRAAKAQSADNRLCRWLTTLARSTPWRIYLPTIRSMDVCPLRSP